MIESIRHTHFADIIYRKYLDVAPVAVRKVSETVPDFPIFFCFYYATEQAGFPQEDSRAGKIYFMRDTATGDIKIGYSENNVPLRAKAHAATRRTEIETLLCLNGCFHDETNFHRLFNPHNIEGEWYKGTPAVMAGINAMQKLYETNPNSDMTDFVEEARWGLFFYPKEVEHYKAIFTLVKADLDRFAEGLLLCDGQKLIAKKKD